MYDLIQINERNPYRRRVDLTRYPSIMTDQPSPKVSAKYQFISDRPIISALAKEGWWPYHVMTTRAIKEGNDAFTRHKIRFQNPDLTTDNWAVGDTVAQMIMESAHDATMCWCFEAGLWRYICSNGMQTSMGKLGGARIKHLGEDVIEGVAEVVTDMLKKVPYLNEKLMSWNNIDLNRDEQEAFASAAIEMKWSPDDGCWVDPRDVLRPNRIADRGDNLWKTFNVIQEKMTKGGVKVYKRDPHTDKVLPASGRRSRATTSVTMDTKLNKDLWTLAESMEKLKTK